MKKFYRAATAAKQPEGFVVLLDGRPLRTPGKALLALPTAGLAGAIAEEWQAQGETIEPTTMPLTKLANTTVDGIEAHRAEIIDQILRFAEHDALCYRATHPAELVRRQSAAWDPLLDWAAERYGARLSVGSGIAHVAQSEAALAALRTVLGGRDAFALAGLHVAASICGSLVLGLAVADGRLDPDAAFALSQLDESFQAEKWGIDSEAEARGRRLVQELASTRRFLACLQKETRSDS